MDYVARLVRSTADPAMLMMLLRRVGATCEFIEPPKGGSDIQVVGTVPDVRFDELVEVLGRCTGAVHGGERHVRLGGGDHETVEAAEAGLPGPFTVPGTSRAAWSFGGDDVDLVVQTLYRGGEMGTKALNDATGIGIERVMRAVQNLAGAGSVRRFRRDTETGTLDVYDMARTVRESIDHASGVD